MLESDKRLFNNRVMNAYKLMNHSKYDGTYFGERGPTNEEVINNLKALSTEFQLKLINPWEKAPNLVFLSITPPLIMVAATAVGAGSLFGAGVFAGVVAAVSIGYSANKHYQKSVDRNKFFKAMFDPDGTDSTNGFASILKSITVGVVDTLYIFSFPALFAIDAFTLNKLEILEGVENALNKFHMSDAMSIGKITHKRCKH